MKNQLKIKINLFAITIVLLAFIVLFAQFVLVNKTSGIVYAGDFNLTSAGENDEILNIPYDIAESYYESTNSNESNNRSNHYRPNSSFSACNQCDSSHGPGKEYGYNTKLFSVNKSNF